MIKKGALRLPFAYIYKVKENIKLIEEIIQLPNFLYLLTLYYMVLQFYKKWINLIYSFRKFIETSR